MNLTATLLIGILGIVYIPHIILHYILWLPMFIQVVIHVPLAVVYWFWTPEKWHAFRQWPGWSLIRDDYLAITYHGPGRDLVVPVDQRTGENGDSPAQHQYCYAVHPHGVHAVGLMFGFATNPAMPDLKAFGTSLLFRIPIVKEMVGWSGALPASRENVLFQLQLGHDIAVAPGGLAELRGLIPEWTEQSDEPYPPESEYYRNWRIRGVVHGRGFLRYAHACGNTVHIVPVWIEGEDELYDTWLPLPKIQRWLLRTRLRYCWPIFAWGHRYVWFWPKRPPGGLRVWVGEPLDLSQETERKAEDRFYDALENLRQMASAILPQVSSAEDTGEDVVNSE